MGARGFVRSFLNYYIGTPVQCIAYTLRHGRPEGKKTSLQQELEMLYRNGWKHYWNNKWLEIPEHKEGVVKQLSLTPEDEKFAHNTFELYKDVCWRESYKKNLETLAENDRRQ